MKEHPTHGELLRFGEWIEQRAVRDVLGHLLECTACRTKMLEQLKAASAPRVGAKVLHFDRPVDYSAVSTWCSDAFEQVLRSGELEWKASSGLLEELLRHPESRREVLLRNSKKFHVLALATRLLDCSREGAFEDPAAAARIVDLAMIVLDGLDVSHYGSRVVDDLRARAWACLGNARRLQADREGAEEAFAKGLRLLEGTADPAEQANFFGLLASLRKDQSRFAEACSLVRQAADLYTEVQDHPRAVRLLVKEASIHLDQGSPELALEPLRRAHALENERVDARTSMAIRHNLALCLAEQGQYLEAQRAFLECRKYYRQFHDPWTELRAKWLEGILAAGTHNFREAENLLLEVRDAYASEGKAFFAAIVTLDLAALYARGRRLPELRRLAEEVAPLLRAEELPREALTILAIFRQTAAREQVTVDLIRDLAIRLKRSSNPSSF